MRIAHITTIIAWSVLAVLLGLAPASADKRVALIIGNSAYKHAAALPNPINDAAAISALFKAAGFDVVESRKNLGVVDMRRAIRDFSDKVRDADIAVVFYAGHGIEVDGTNYLLPTDAVLERDMDVEDEGISLDRIVKMLDPAKRLRLVILDACRDNPFARTMKRTTSTRSVGRGLAKVEPTSSDTLIAFAAKAGSTASDGSGENSPFTAALLKNIATPGLDLRIAFGQVRDDVLKSTNNRQEPFVYGSLGGATASLVPPPAQPIIAPNSNATGQPNVDEARKDFEFAAQLGSKEAWEVFLSKHSVGFHADLARRHLAKLIEDAKKTDEAAKNAAADAKKAAEEAKKAGEAAKKAAEESRRVEEAKRASAPPVAPPTTSRSTETPKTGGNKIVCGPHGCQELKPGTCVTTNQQGFGNKTECR